MNLEISNKIHKSLLTIGFSLIVYSVYSLDKLKFKQIDILLNEKVSNNNSIKLLYEYSEWYDKIYILGIILTGAGILVWIREFEPKTVQETKFKHCQSCGEKFSGRKNYGNFKDNNYNYSYCEDCYEDGRFTNPNLQIEDFLTEDNIKNYNKNLLKVSFEQYLKSLERWNNKRY